MVTPPREAPHHACVGAPVRVRALCTPVPGDPMSLYRFTSESVTEGHPDKICDAVSDSVLDAILAQDPKARVACESLAKTGMVIVAGEITTTAYVDIPTIVRNTIREIGYVHSEM